MKKNDTCNAAVPARLRTVGGGADVQLDDKDEQLHR